MNYMELPRHLGKTLAQKTIIEQWQNYFFNVKKYSKHGKPPNIYDQIFEDVEKRVPVREGSPFIDTMMGSSNPIICLEDSKWGHYVILGFVEVLESTNHELLKNMMNMVGDRMDDYAFLEGGLVENTIWK